LPTLLSDSLSTVLYVVEIAVAIGLLILVHELGHFLTAKWFGVRVRRFALGFGPCIVHWKRGDTEYSLRWIPIGGFVDLVGEHPEAEGADDPKALWRRPVWQRAVIFAAGVAMNLVLALALFILAPAIGMRAAAPIVGGVVERSPAARADIRPGDRIVSINGQVVQCFEDVNFVVGLRKAGTEFRIVVERESEAGEEPQRLTKTLVSDRMPGMPVPMIGVAPAGDVVIYKLDDPDSPAAQAGLKAGDRILTIAGKPVRRWDEIKTCLEAVPPGPLELQIVRDGKEQTRTVDPGHLTQPVFGMMPPTAVTDVERNSPAEAAGVRQGDWILKAGGFEWPTTDELKESVQKAGPGGEVTLHLFRKGWLFWPNRTIDATCKVARLGDDEQPRIGVAMGYEIGPPLLVAGVEPDGPAAAAGFRRGDEILAVMDENTKPKDWSQLLTVLREKATDQPVSVFVRRGAGDLVLSYQVEMKPLERFTLAGTEGEVLRVSLPRITNPLSAVKRGIRQTLLWLGRVYANLAQLIRGEADFRSLGGPVRVVRISYEYAAQGPGTFINFWGILSVCLVVFNFLPLPPLDGGHVLFLLIEKVRGKPVPMKIRDAIWIVGIVLVVILFVLLTYQDILLW